jgi:hypothetical protein
MAIKILAAATLAAMISLPLASSDAQQVMIQGDGTKSCADYLNAMKGVPWGDAKAMTWTDGRTYWSEAAQYLNWIDGYISGFNVFAVRDPRRGAIHQVTIEEAAIDARVRNYCRAHPASIVAEALWSVISSQAGGNGKGGL